MKLINEAKRLQKLAGLLTEEEENYELAIDFGPFKNIHYYTSGDKNFIHLNIDRSDNFQEIENSIEYNSDELSSEQEDFLNDQIKQLAQQMSAYLTKIGIKNQIVDVQLGYGQEIDNPEIEINKSDLNKLL